MDASSTLGVFPDFEYAGARYKIARRKFRTEAAIEAWLKGKARDDVVALWSGHPMLEANLRVLQQDCAAEQYAFGGYLYQAAMTTLSGLKERVYLDLGQENPQVTRDQVAALAGDDTPLPTGRVDEQGHPITETHFDRLLRALREANAPLARTGATPGAAPSASPSSPPPSPASPGASPTPAP